MIQRIQSIYLVIGAIALGLLFQASFDFGTIASGAVEGPIWSDGDLDADDSLEMKGLVGMAVLALLGSIFFFKNRDLQAKMVTLTLFLILGIAAFAGYQMITQTSVAEGAGATVAMGIGFANPIVALLFAGLALRSINKDEKLVQSMDRLR